MMASRAMRCIDDGGWAKGAVFALFCLTGSAVSAGCQEAYFLVNPAKSKTVKAEYGKLDGSSVAVLVWADSSILDEYPHVRRQVCQSVTHHMRKHLPDATLVAPRKIEAFQTETHANWLGMSHDDICEALECDFILRIDMLEFTTRASNTRALRKARVSAALNLYECGPLENLDPVYDTEIKTTFPPDSLHGKEDMGESGLLHEAVEYFAEIATQKFYDHERQLQAGKSW